MYRKMQKYCNPRSRTPEPESKEQLLYLFGIFDGWTAHFHREVQSHPELLARPVRLCKNDTCLHTVWIVGIFEAVPVFAHQTNAWLPRQGKNWHHSVFCLESVEAADNVSVSATSGVSVLTTQIRRHNRARWIRHHLEQKNRIINGGFGRLSCLQSPTRHTDTKPLLSLSPSR